MAEASEARLYARTRYEQSIGNLLAGPFRPIGSRLSRKCGVDAIRQAPCGIWRSQPIFRPAPFHADKFSLKRGLKKRPLWGNNGFLRMSDDSFIREVNEEIRREQAQA
ncbi:MAG: hypothetical protein E5W15_29060, partial [Mesorhizobium sp.]